MSLIAGRLALADVMKCLSIRRSVFHSEADFQFEFARTVADLGRDIRVRLEVPVRREDTKRSEYIDLRCETDEMRSLIEFKYVTRSWEGVDPTTNEQFALRNHSAMDLARFHFIHDVYRLENWTKDRSDVNGFAILLTNDPSLWEPPRRRSITRDAEYRIHEGRTLPKSLVWGTPERPYPLNDRTLRGSYTANWHGYGPDLDGTGGRRRWLGWEIVA
jgi:hypothetical protein